MDYLPKGNEDITVFLDRLAHHNMSEMDYLPKGNEDFVNALQSY